MSYPTWKNFLFAFELIALIRAKGSVIIKKGMILLITIIFYFTGTHLSSLWLIQPLVS